MINDTNCSAHTFAEKRLVIPFTDKSVTLHVLCAGRKRVFTASFAYVSIRSKKMHITEARDEFISLVLSAIDERDTDVACKGHIALVDFIIFNLD